MDCTWKMRADKYCAAFVVFGLVTMVTSQVDVDQVVNGIMGEDSTLRCIYIGLDTPGSISWQKIKSGNPVRIAQATPDGYRVDFDAELSGRLNFTDLNSERRVGSIRITNLYLSDAGNFICSFATLDASEATISLTVYASPNVFLELNPSQLVDGMGLVTVATCVAQGGNPAASITWSGLQQGSSNETTETEPDGTVTVRSRYWLEPTRESHGWILTCRVEHTALGPPAELSTTLNIHYKPNVTITGYNGDWLVGKESASLTCNAGANPGVERYQWDRLGDSLPSGMVERGNSLSFERPLMESDSGLFSCWANNSVGWDEEVVNITIWPASENGGTISFHLDNAVMSTILLLLISSLVALP